MNALVHIPVRLYPCRQILKRDTLGPCTAKPLN
jgi:hypothetical protein